MTDSANVLRPLVEAPPTVTSHAICRHCGYDLHGLPADGRCPECGSGVGESLSAELLIFADPNLLATLVRGVRILLIGFGLVVVLFFIVGFAFVRSHSEDVCDAVLEIGGASIVCWCAVGSWLVSRPDPSGCGEREFGRSRKIARVALLLGAAQGLLDCAFVFGGRRLAIYLSFVGAETILAQVIGVVGVFAHLDYFPEYDLSQRARFLKSALGISGGILVLVIIVRQPGGRSALRRGLRTALACTGGLAIVPLVIFVVMYLNLLGKLSARLRQLSDAAQKSWSASV
jgi:hypothetical protein